MLTYEDCKRTLDSARSPADGKPLQRNTRLHERGENFAVRLHDTDVVTIRPNGTYIIATGGWDTVTTWDRIITYGPRSLYRTLLGKQDERYMRTRPNANDPDPTYPRREIPRYFVAADPGPEPVKSDEGCAVGEAFTFTEERYTCEAGDWARRPVTIEGAYTERRSYERDGRQCPHCAAFDKAKDVWYQRYYGGWNTGRSNGCPLGYKTYAEMMDRFGDEQTWRAAFKTEGREVRAGQARWREWNERNRIPFHASMTVNSDGYPLRDEERRVRARERALKREMAKLDREHQREMERLAALERFRARMLKNRRPCIAKIADETVEHLQVLNAKLES